MSNRITLKKLQKHLGSYSVKHLIWSCLLTSCVCELFESFSHLLDHTLIGFDHTGTSAV